MSEKQENSMVDEGSVDQGFTVGNSDSNPTFNENLLNVKTLERCFNERIDREMGNIVETVEDRIQNAILTVIDGIITPDIELAIRSINASSGQDAASATVNSERGEHIRIIIFSKRYPKGIIHYMCLIQIIRLEIIFQTR